MQNGSIIRICDDCASYVVIADEPVVPTSELPTHLALQNYLLETGSCYKATLHTHPIELVAMSHIQRFLKGDEMTRVLWSMIPETLAFAPLGIGIVPYALPSSVDLAEATLEKIKTHDVVMWEKHGTVAVGQDIMDAFDQTDVLCKAANIYMCARAMGSEPDGMTEAQMKEVQDVFKLPKKRPC
jgi:rhamnulose-1-phosphate aldolase